MINNEDLTKTNEAAQGADASPTESNAQAQTAAQDATPDPLETLNHKLKEAEQKYVYLYAEFDNYKKRAVKERQDIVKFGWENVASDLLLVLDNFERALQYAKPESDPNLVNGLQMVASQFRATLEKQGVQTISSLDQTFNPEIHEAVAQQPSDKSSGIIIQEHQKGYLLHGRLLRPSRVVVSSGAANH